MSQLATLVSKAIRLGTWKPENRAPFFHMSKDIARHARRGFDTTELDKALAHPVYSEMAGIGDFDRGARPLIELARQIFDACQPDGHGPVCQHAFDTAKRSGHLIPSPPTFQYAVLEFIERDEKARIAEFGDPYETIRKAVDAAVAAHPRLGLSSGYLGGVGLGCGPHGDDRRWYVFAKLATPMCLGACDVHYGGVPTDRIEDLAAMMDERFQTWLDKCETDLDAGRIRIVGERQAA